MTGRTYPTCSADGCSRDRKRGSIMCPRHTDAVRLKREYSTSDGTHKSGQLALSPEQVDEARRMWSQFKTYPEIARHFGVSLSTIRAAIKRSREATS